MKYKITAEAEYESREELVEYVCNQVSQIINAVTRTGMDTSGVLADEPSEVWCFDWRRLVTECDDAVSVRDIVEQYSTEQLEEITNYGLSVAANGMLQRPEAQRDFAVVIMSAITKAITGTDPDGEGDADGSSDVHKALAAYMTDVSEGFDGFNGEDFFTVRRGRSIVLAIKGPLDDPLEDYLLSTFSAPGFWDDHGTCYVAEDGGVEPEQLSGINFVVFLADDPNQPVGIADTVENAQLIHDWFSSKGQEALVVATGQVS